MRFTPFAFLAVVGTASGFVTPSTNRGSSRSVPRNGISNLETKLFESKSITKDSKSKKKQVVKSNGKKKGKNNDNTGIVNGVLLGAAPLILAPLAGLVVGRNILAGTASRRAEIEKEIAAREKAEKNKVDTEIDGGGLALAAGAFAAAGLALGIVVAPSFINDPAATSIEAANVVQVVKPAAKDESSVLAADKLKAIEQSNADKNALLQDKKELSAKEVEERKAETELKEKKALAAKEKTAEAEADKKAAQEKEIRAKEDVLAAEAKLKRQAPLVKKSWKEANFKSSVAPKEMKKKPTPSGLGVVKGGEIGGRVSAKEDPLSSGTLDFLKKYSKAPK
eukprot:CAMPEP_0194129926 /NCGR_PEP_ID=MMETSP0152-20130528/1117_1 /TAXON_ID=1049557 /ORGANISM="Thalassiothrix antarctica, Strain L6-D1" /LENGTH=336 /DNA_ID=CAMNT_0038824315 /DNA_START=76 /DNA_END=1086 /DNA_ORIENTATION=-